MIGPCTDGSASKKCFTYMKKTSWVMLPLLVVFTWIPGMLLSSTVHHLEVTVLFGASPFSLPYSFLCFFFFCFWFISMYEQQSARIFNYAIGNITKQSCQDTAIYRVRLHEQYFLTHPPTQQSTILTVKQANIFTAKQHGKHTTIKQMTGLCTISLCGKADGYMPWHASITLWCLHESSCLAGLFKGRRICFLV